MGGRHELAPRSEKPTWQAGAKRERNLTAARSPSKLPPLRRCSAARAEALERVGACLLAAPTGREVTGMRARLASMGLALVTGWLIAWGTVAVAGSFSYLRHS